MHDRSSMKQILDEYEAHLLEDLEKNGHNYTSVTAESWATLNMGRMIDSLGDAIDTYTTQVKLLKRENDLLREENERLKKQLRQK